MDRTLGAIRTPDQRLRVFVSSTLNELAAERKAVRSAIERLRLAPVMFELGARPHAPRDLYRAYLEQSDLFVGLYWERYGWIAPGEDISGLEDEYLLSTGMPKLIYIKEPADAREPRLTELLDHVLVDGTASFKSFTTAQELGELLEADLATLLAERFALSRESTLDEPSIDIRNAAALPAPLTELIGRDSEVLTVREMLERDAVRLVTLTGSGGIGKSRLAIGVANRVVDQFTGGVAFVNLAPVQEASQVPAAIAQAIGVRDTGDGPLGDKLTTALRHRQLLLVIDNFEQVLDAAPTLTALLSGAPELKLLVTSRTLLRVSGEHAFEVGPLALPGPDLRPKPEDVLASPSVELFVERARAVKPDFDVTVDNVEAIAKICLALEGVPLALELAAARIRMLPPAAMLARLDRQLPLLVGGVRDLPARQQALRSTIEWSTQLLSDDEKRLLALLGVFAGAFSLEAVEFVSAGTGAAGQTGTDALTSLGILVDNSLVRQQDRESRSVFTILTIVGEYAREKLEADGLLDAVRARHAEYYVGLGARIEFELEGSLLREWVGSLTDERDNLRAAVRYLLDTKDWSTATTFAWTLYVYWWVGGHLGEVRGWMDEVLAADEPLPDLTRAVALYFTCAIAFWQDPDGRVVPGLTESAELFHRAHEQSGEALARVSLALALLSAASPNPVQADAALETSLDLFRRANDRWGEAMALITLGRVALLQQQVHAALNHFDESLVLARQQQDDLGTTIALHHLGWTHLLLGHFDTARESFEESLALSASLGHDEGVAYGLEGLVAIAASAGQIERAGHLLGASESLREQTGLYNAPTFSFHQQLVDPILAGEHAEVFGAARAHGRAMSAEEALDVALSAPALSDGRMPGRKA